MSSKRNSFFRRSTPDEKRFLNIKNNKEELSLIISKFSLSLILLKTYYEKILGEGNDPNSKEERILKILKKDDEEQKIKYIDLLLNELNKILDDNKIDFTEDNEFFNNFRIFNIPAIISLIRQLSLIDDAIIEFESDLKQRFEIINYINNNVNGDLKNLNNNRKKWYELYNKLDINNLFETFYYIRPELEEDAKSNAELSESESESDYNSVDGLSESENESEYSESE